MHNPLTCSPAPSPVRAAALGLLAALLLGGLLPASGHASSAFGPAVPRWTMRPATGPVPAVRDGHAMAYDASSGQVVLFGGKGSRSRYYNDLWAYTLNTATWRQLKPNGQAPPARFGHAMACDDRSKEMLVFGGVTTDHLSNDLWAYRGTSNSWARLRPRGAAPPARVYPSMADDPARGEAIVFGGWTGTQSFGDTWRYSVRANRWTLSRTTQAPSARWGAAMAYDPATGLIVLFGGLFGGYDGRDRLNDTWAYNPRTDTWRNLRPGGALPPSRGYVAMDYDAATKTLVLYGGFAGPWDCSPIPGHTTPQAIGGAGSRQPRPIPRGGTLAPWCTTSRHDISCCLAASPAKLATSMACY